MASFHTLLRNFSASIRWSICLVFISTLLQICKCEPRVVCYYTNWSVYRPGTAKYTPQNINPYLCTHLIYAFGGFTNDNALKPFDSYQDIEKGGYAKFTGLKTYNKHLKTMLAIGGWNEASKRFSALSASPERRKTFVKNVIKYLRQNNFDGLDLDWEYPAFRDGGKPHDRENYANLVQELREEFDRESRKTGRTRLLLTMAVPAGIQYIEKGYDVPKLNKYLDFFNLLSYDYHSAFEPSVNHHSPLFPLEEVNEYNYDSELNIDYTIKYYIEAGADADKLVLGIPTYGRSYTLFNPDATDIGSPADGPGEMGDATREKGYLAYYEICESLMNDREWEVVQPNANAMGPYAFKGNQWVGYDDIDIVRLKSKYVVDKGLGGIMFWSIDNDDFRGTCHGKPYPLIEAAKESYLEELQKNGQLEITSNEKPTKTTHRVNHGSSSKTSSSTKKTDQKGHFRNQGNRKGGSTAETTVLEKVQSHRPTFNQRKTTPRSVSSTSHSLIVTPMYTTPEPPTTPDTGSDFKCEDEGFFPHPRDCKKYFWCLSSGPSDLGIVAHQFTCPSGLYFNKLTDSCDYSRNVYCKKKSDTPKATTTTPTTTEKAKVTLKTTTRAARPIFTTTTTTEAPEEDYEEESDGKSEVNDFFDSEEDPKVIKELIALIKKLGGVEELEKHLQYQETQSPDTSSTVAPVISKHLYNRVINTRNKQTFQQPTQPTVKNVQYSSLTRNRFKPQNEGISALNEESSRTSGNRKTEKTYTNIVRSRKLPSGPDPIEEEDDEEEDDGYEVVDRNQEDEAATVVRSRLSSAVHRPEYVTIRRNNRPSSTETTLDEVEEKSDRIDSTASPNYVTFQRRRTSSPLSFVSTTDSDGTTNKRLLSHDHTSPEYVTFVRRQPTESSLISFNQNEADVETETTKLRPSDNYVTFFRRGPTTESSTLLSTDAELEAEEDDDNQISFAKRRPTTENGYNKYVTIRRTSPQTFEQTASPEQTSSEITSSQAYLISSSSLAPFVDEITSTERGIFSTKINENLLKPLINLPAVTELLENTDSTEAIDSNSLENFKTTTETVKLTPAIQQPRPFAINRRTRPTTTARSTESTTAKVSETNKNLFVRRRKPIPQKVEVKNQPDVLIDVETTTRGRNLYRRTRPTTQSTTPSTMQPVVVEEITEKLVEEPKRRRVTRLRKVQSSFSVEEDDEGTSTRGQNQFQRRRITTASTEQTPTTVSSSNGNTNTNTNSRYLRRNRFRGRTTNINSQSPVEDSESTATFDVKTAFRNANKQNDKYIDEDDLENHEENHDDSQHKGRGSRKFVEIYSDEVSGTNKNRIRSRTRVQAVPKEEIIEETKQPTRFNRVNTNRQVVNYRTVSPKRLQTDSDINLSESIKQETESSEEHSKGHHRRVVLRKRLHTTESPVESENTSKELTTESTTSDEARLTTYSESKTTGHTRGTTQRPSTVTESETEDSENGETTTESFEQRTRKVLNRLRQLISSTETYDEYSVTETPSSGITNSDVYTTINDDGLTTIIEDLNTIKDESIGETSVQTERPSTRVTQSRYTRFRTRKPILRSSFAPKASTEAPTTTTRRPTRPVSGRYSFRPKLYRPSGFIRSKETEEEGKTTVEEVEGTTVSITGNSDDDNNSNSNSIFKTNRQNKSITFSSRNRVNQINNQIFQNDQNAQIKSEIVANEAANKKISLQERNRNLFQSRRNKINVVETPKETTTESGETTTLRHIFAEDSNSETPKLVTLGIIGMTKHKNKQNEDDVGTTTAYPVYPKNETAIKLLAEKKIMQKLIEVNRIVEVNYEKEDSMHTLLPTPQRRKIGEVNRLTVIKVIDGDDVSESKYKTVTLKPDFTELTTLPIQGLFNAENLPTEDSESRLLPTKPISFEKHESSNFINIRLLDQDRDKEGKSFLLDLGDSPRAPIRLLTEEDEASLRVIPLSKAKQIHVVDAPIRPV